MMDIERKGDLWVLTDTVSEDEYELFLDYDVVFDLVELLNKASCEGADWPIYEVSCRGRI